MCLSRGRGKEAVIVRINRGLLGWGVFFIVVGVVPLAVRNGMIDPAVLSGVFSLWPLILVGIGVGLVLAQTKAAVLGNVIVAITAGLIGGAFLAGATATVTGFGMGPCGLGGGGSGGASFEGQGGAFTRAAEVRLEMRCGTVEGGLAPGTTWSLEGTAAAGFAPVVSAGEDRLRIAAPSRNGVSIGATPTRWTLKLPDAVDMDLGLSVDAGSANLGLDAARVTGASVTVNAGDARVGLRDDASLGTLDASVNAGSLTLDMPASSWRGRVSVNAGSAEMCLPEGTALRVHADDVSLGSTNLAARGLAQDGSTWTTPGFTGATTRAELDLSVNLGSFSLNPEDGCG
jgi:hypothetical protein